MRDMSAAIRKHVSQTGLSLSEVGRILGVSATECLNWWSGFATLPEHANFKAMNDVMLEEKAKQKFTFAALPERYRQNAFSYVSSSRHILAIIRMQYGERVLRKTLADLGVHEVYFKDINNKISIQFFEDILEAYLKLGNSDQELNSLSKGLFLSVEGSELEDKFKATAQYEEAYSQIAASTSKFDTNFDYKWNISKDGFDLYSKPSDELADSMKNSRYGSDALYKYRSRLFGNMVMLSGLSPLPLQVKACVSRGDSTCHYSGHFVDACQFKPSLSLV